MDAVEVHLRKSFNSSAQTDSVFILRFPIHLVRLPAVLRENCNRNKADSDF
jgi:hypothetical protein